MSEAVDEGVEDAELLLCVLPGEFLTGDVKKSPVCETSNCFNFTEEAFNFGLELELLDAFLSLSFDLLIFSVTSLLPFPALEEDDDDDDDEADFKVDILGFPELECLGDILECFGLECFGLLVLYIGDDPEECFGLCDVLGFDVGLELFTKETVFVELECVGDEENFLNPDDETTRGGEVDEGFVALILTETGLVRGSCLTGTFSDPFPGT